MNRLAQEASPYLRQHADNPVDWQPWSDEAFDEARRRDVPVLLSIGYSACHWCHVMAHESFEDDATAAVMNDGFVNIKVDREERPDVDAIYMEAVQAMTGSGGWPMTVFLTADGEPFYGGTYFPKVRRQGMPAFTELLGAIRDAWTTRRPELLEQAGKLADAIRSSTSFGAADGAPDRSLLDAATAAILGSIDLERGGVGRAPKFPQTMSLDLLLRMHARTGDPALLAAVQVSLDAMASGGIYDHLGGGFARYSVDAKWLVPHFEKMLYDNGLLARAYLHGWQVTGDALLRRVCEETLDWALREMRGPEGGFYSALDADSEGVEGKFYVWSLDELRSIAGDEAAAWLGATAEGNFEGENILTRGEGNPVELDEWRSKLYDVRKERVWPGLDDKRLCSWNALMITALADAGAALERDDYLDAARKCADFVLTQMRDGDGRLLRTWKDGDGRLNAYLEDHAYLVEALVTLYEASWEPPWLTAARAIADTMIERFADEERGGFFDTASDHERLVARRKSLEDNPIPSGNSSAAYGLLRLAALTGERDYEQHAVGVFRLLHEVATRHPQAFAHLLQALDFHFASVKEVAIVGPRSAELARVVRRRFRPHLVLAGGEPDGVPLMEGRETPGAYVCENFTCQRPVTEPAELEELLSA